jgi:hypothetical protein
LPVDSLLPVHVPAVEYRPVAEQYPLRLVRGGLDTEELHPVTDENDARGLQPELHSLRNRGNSWQRRAYFDDYSFIVNNNFGESGEERSSIKSNLKLSGTYDTSGEFTVNVEEKGIYIDRFS